MKVKPFFISTIACLSSAENFSAARVICSAFSAGIHNTPVPSATIISPLAYVSKHAAIGEGSIIMNGAVVNAKSIIGKNCIINTKSNVEHGVSIGDFCHISTCAVINGDSLIGKGSFIGSNATISNGISIKKNSIISAGKFIK